MPDEYAISTALAATAPARARLTRIYGNIPPTVYFIQRREDGPVKIGFAQRLAGRVAEFYRECPDPVIVRAVVPGGRALEAWFHRRHGDLRAQGEWFREADSITVDARRFGELHEAFLVELDSRNQATVATVCEMDPFIGDIFRLYTNGVTQTEIGRLAGISQAQVVVRLNSLRAMGFEIPHRRVYASRGDAGEARRRRQARYEGPMRPGSRRFLA